MQYKFDSAKLTQRLLNLPHPERLGFAALIFDRAIPNFLRFESETGASGGATLRGAQARVWGLVEQNGVEVLFQNVTSQVCERLSPDSDDNSSLYTSSAIDAVSIACNVLDYIKSRKIDLLVESASLRRDSVDMFLQLADYVDSSTPDFEAKLIAHPLMQEELGFQDVDLVILERCKLSGTKCWPLVLRQSLDFEYSKLRMLPPRS